MLKPIPLKMVGGTKFSRYKKISSELTLNMAVSGADVGNPTLVPYAGYQKKITFPSGEARGLFTGTHLKGMIAVFGSSVYLISSQLNFRLIGSLDTTSGFVHIQENFNSQICIEDNLKIYIYDYANSSFTTPEIDFRPIYLTFKDTFFIATGDDDRAHYSDTNQGEVWPTQNNFQLQTDGDILQAAVSFQTRIWMVGQNISEIWNRQPTQLVVYQRDNSAAVSYGAVSRETIASDFGLLVWLAKSKQSTPSIAFSVGGAGQPQFISDGGLDYIFTTLTAPQDSVASLYQVDGHVFYHLTFYTDNFSIAYDFDNKEVYVLTDENLNHHIAKEVVEFDNKLYFISFVDSALYEMSTNYTTYDGATIPRFRVPENVIFPDGKPRKFRKLVLTAEQGNSSDEHRIDLSISNDSGVTFGNTISQRLNTLGHRQGTVVFRNFGRSNDFTPKFGFWSQDRFVINDGILYYEECL